MPPQQQMPPQQGYGQQPGNYGAPQFQPPFSTKAPKNGGGAKVGIIIGAVVVLLLLAGGALWFLNSDKSTEKAVSEKNPELLVIEEPEFSDLPASSMGISDAPYDYTSMVCYHELTDQDLMGCPKSELRLMRNTIYARHGYRFHSQDLLDYFSQFDWYKPRTDVVPENDMSQTELANIALIKRHE